MAHDIRVLLKNGGEDPQMLQRATAAAAGRPQKTRAIRPTNNTPEPGSVP